MFKLPVNFGGKKTDVQYCIMKILEKKYFVRRGFFMEKVCLVGGLKGLHREGPCETDVGHCTEISPSSQD